MKTLACMGALFVCGVVNAQAKNGQTIVKKLIYLSMLIPTFALAQQVPVPLQIPVPGTYSGSHCSWANENQIVVVGFSPDGSLLTASVRGWVACGYERGLNYSYWCGSISWDLEGNFQGFVGVSNKLPGTWYGCPRPDPTLTFTNAGGYTAWTTTVAGYYGYEMFANPHLDTP